MKASWTASSARSKSPRTRISVATARPCSSRNRRSTTSCVVGVGGRQPADRSDRRLRLVGRREVDDRPDLDRSDLGARALRREIERLVEVLASTR